MYEMSEEELQQALETAEKLHVVAENTIQKSLQNSKIFLDKCLELREAARKRGIELQSLYEKVPGKFEILQKTYKALE